MGHIRINEEKSTFLVLGGCGFIGSHLIAALLEQGFRVRCFDLPNIVPIRSDFINASRFELIEGNFANDGEVAKAMEGCDVCYHLVSTTLPKSSNADPVFDVESNVVATIKFLNNAVKYGIKKVIFVSSGGTVYGNPSEIPISEDHPINPICSYGITKFTIERYLEAFYILHGLDYTVLRISNPFGEGQRIQANQGVIAVFLGKILKGEPVEIWGDGSVVRDFIYISDVIDALLKAVRTPCGERIFNIGSGEGLSLNDIINRIEKIRGIPVKRNYIPGRAFDVPVNILNIKRAEKHLDWRPKIEFDSGLRKFIEWLENAQ